MNNLEQVNELIILLASTGTVVLTFIGSVVALIKGFNQLKNERNKIASDTADKIEKFNKQMMKMNSKLVSIETTLMKDKEVK